jgi:hypothetical protein
MSAKDFYTRDAANEGKKVELTYPDGRPSGFHLVVRSQWSDEFQVAKAKALQYVASLVGRQEVDIKQIAKEQELHCAVALIAGWNFPEEFTPENVLEFLRNAPQVRDRVSKLAGSDRSFFKSGSTPS